MQAIRKINHIFYSSLDFISDMQLWHLAFTGPLHRRDQLGLKLFSLVRQKGIGSLQNEHLVKIGFRSFEARRLLAFMELHRRLCRQLSYLDEVHSPHDAHRLFSPFLSLSDKEEFFVAACHHIAQRFLMGVSFKHWQAIVMRAYPANQ